MSATVAHGQLVTSTALSPQQLVQDVLVGTGVSTSNIVFTGDANAIGSFDGSACNVGLDSGIVLTTGTVLDQVPFGIQEGPFGPNNESGAGVDNMQPGDPLLAAITGTPSFNAARLEFDFVPQSDSIKFNFVFGSEEYLEFVNAGVNDAFGFFISGPNPLGGNYSDENIALVPGTGQAVTIDNVNDVSNPAYYIDNGDGFTAPFNGSNTYIQYDGMTTVMTAKANVTCGQTYHIVIVISDIGDGILDSGVFLEAGSFTSPGISISADLNFQSASGNDSTLVEGCGSADLWFVRTDSIPFQQDISLSYSGAATNGVDVNLLPSQISFPAGSDSVSLNINAVFDNLTEGLEDLTIIATLTSSCGNPITDSLTLYIEDVLPLEVNVDDETVPCPNDDVTLTAQGNFGTPGYSYLWNTGETTTQITVSPAITTDYWVTITDTCGQVAADTAQVLVPAFGPIQIVTTPDTTINCPNTTITLNAQSSGGGAGHTFTWSHNDSGPTTTVVPSNTTQYTVTVTDACGLTASETITVTLDEIPLTATITSDTTVCPGEPVTLVVTPSGGVGNDYDFQWDTGETDSIITVNPTEMTEYVVGISDGCGFIKLWDSVTVNTISIHADFAATGLIEEGSEVQFNNFSVGADSYLWDLGNDVTATTFNTSMTFENAGDYQITLYAFNSLGCMDSATIVLGIKPEFTFYAPNSFTPDGDEFNQNWQVFVTGHDAFDFELLIFNRWGEVIWENHDATIGWDGIYKGHIVPTGTYTWKAVVKLPYNDERREFMGSINVLK